MKIYLKKLWESVRLISYSWLLWKDEHKKVQAADPDKYKPSPDPVFEKKLLPDPTFVKGRI